MKEHFDKLLLSVLFLGGLATHLYFSRSAEFYANAVNREHLMDTVRWLQEIDGQILAALLTLMVGRSMAASAHALPSGQTDVQIGPPNPNPTTPANPAP